MSIPDDSRDVAIFHVGIEDDTNIVVEQGGHIIVREELPEEAKLRQAIIRGISKLSPAILTSIVASVRQQIEVIDRKNSWKLEFMPAGLLGSKNSLATAARELDKDASDDEILAATRENRTSVIPVHADTLVDIQDAIELAITKSILNPPLRS